MTSVRTHVIALTAGVLIAGAVQAQPFDPLAQTRQERTLKSQKMKSELNDNLIEADRIRKSNPEKARDLLYKNRLILNEDLGTLSTAEHRGYLNLVTSRLDAIADRADAQQRSSELASLKSVEIAAFRSKLDYKARKALALGNPSPSRVLGAYQQQYKNKAIAMMNFQNAMLAQINAAQKDGYYKPPVNRNAIPKKDIEMMKALNSSMRFEFNGVPMKEVLDYIEVKCRKAGLDVTFLPDELAFKDAGQDIDVFKNDPIIAKYNRPLKVRNFLHIILYQRGFGYYLEDGIINIAPKAKVDMKMITKNYIITNLVGGPSLVQQAQQQALQGNANGYVALLEQNVTQLVEQVAGTIEPDHWRLNPASTAPGGMKHNPASDTLIVRCSLEVHYLLQASGMLDNNKKP